MKADAVTDNVNVSSARRLKLPVLDRRPARRDFLWLTLAAPADWRSLPGQFINVLCVPDEHAPAATDGRVLDGESVWPRTEGLELTRPGPIVRRPYSVSRIQREGDRVRLVLLVQRRGAGSRFLQERPVGQALDVVGPLGTYFTPPTDERLCVLVSGGCGLAPILGLADHLAALGKPCLSFFGCPTVDAAPLTFRKKPAATRDRPEATEAIEEFAAAGIPTVLATDDGSAGFRGPVTAALDAWLHDRGDGRPLTPVGPALYGCGPEPMLKALAKLAEGHDLPCQVSLERYMGCGVGVCLSCVAKRRDPASDKGWSYFLTCRDGPVVDAREIVWDET